VRGAAFYRDRLPVSLQPSNVNLDRLDCSALAFLLRGATRKAARKSWHGDVVTAALLFLDHDRVGALSAKHDLIVS
jgi:hypothetical protein